VPTPSCNGYAHVAFAVGLLVVSVAASAPSGRGWLAPVGILFVLAFHPAWTIEPGHAHDFSQRQTGTAATVLAAAIVLGQVVWIAWTSLGREPSDQIRDYSDEHVA
jgi:hypothetical protein